MKKIIISLILTVMLAMLTGCVDSAAETEKRFVEISDEGTYGVSVYYDKQTKVEYAIKNNGHGGTALSLLVDAEGKPLLYEGE